MKKRLTKKSTLSRQARNMVKKSSPEDKEQVKKGLKYGWRDGASGSLSKVKW